ncbi:MAG TPA: hypothetical protein VN579_04430 [Bryobacteraceae bacterium]|nr:hypothetical protein [Bryobacteraceae bacterium]
MIIEGNPSARYRWTVYGLADARAPADFFYIGKSFKPHLRFQAHKCARTPAGERLREIQARGGTVVMVPLLETDNGMRAANFETQEIVKRPKTVNRQRARCEPTRQVGASLTLSMIRRLEAEQKRRGADSMSETIRALLEKALK